jgi:hypothetical protein
MTACNHDWHFSAENTLRCQRCGTYNELQAPQTQDLVSEALIFGMAWSQNGKRIDPATIYKSLDDHIQEARQAELDACCTLLEGMHAASTGNHNYYLHAAQELRKLRGKT